ncbi:MAG: transposase family protein [Solibacillus sp.]|uniref:transposase family protein n=1 Tax=Solibacillus sp. TaxID=1909654 RepID=UPI00331626F7
MNIPGLKGLILENCEQLQRAYSVHISMPKREYTCPACGDKTAKVHDYRMQKIKHLKWRVDWNEGRETPAGTARAENPLTTGRIPLLVS